MELSVNFLVAFSFFILGLSFVVAALGTLLPGIPGSVLVVISAFFFNWVNPGSFGVFTLGVLIFLALLSWLIDFLASMMGAKLGGATRYGMIGAGLGGLAVFVMGLPGLILGPFLGAIAGDLYGKRTEIYSLIKSGAGAALGFLISVVLRFTILLIMAIVILFGLWV
jgi:uncharacterized protein YqgC (DUF456 family)